MTEDQEFERFLDEISYLTRPGIITLMGLCSALIVGASFWRSLIAAGLIFVLMVGGLGRRTLEKVCLAGSFVALMWWMQIPAVVEAVAAAHGYLIAARQLG